MKIPLCLFNHLFKHIDVLIFIILLPLFSSCQDHESFYNQLNGLEFKLLTFDEDQVERNVFDSGSDINIALKVTNTSNKKIDWYCDFTCLLFQTEEFLFIYKKNGEDETSNFVGTPYQSPINCPAINLPPQIVLPGESVLIKLSWSSNSENEPLTIGKYYVTANIDLHLVKEGEKSLNQNILPLRTDFEMK